MMSYPIFRDPATESFCQWFVDDEILSMKGYHYKMHKFYCMVWLPYIGYIYIKYMCTCIQYIHTDCKGYNIYLYVYRTDRSPGTDRWACHVDTPWIYIWCRSGQVMFGSKIEAVDFSCLKSRMNKLTMTIQLGFFFQDHRVSLEKLWSSWNSSCLCQESLKSEIAHVLVRILRKKRLPPCTSDLWTEFVSSLSFCIFFFSAAILFLLPEPTAHLPVVQGMGASHDVTSQDFTPQDAICLLILGKSRLMSVRK